MEVNERKEQELRQLMAVSHTVETDPERLRKLMEASGEPGYTCHIVWLADRPFGELPDAYKQVELELYFLGRYNDGVLVTILDSTKYRNIVTGLVKALNIDSLPVLIISPKPIDLKKPERENTVIIKGEALERLARHDKLRTFISSIPDWASLEVENRAKWEAKVKTLLGEIYDQIESLISINTPLHYH